MMTLPLGFIGIAGIIFFALRDANLQVFLNSHSILLVLGGTAFTLLFTSPWNDLRGLAFALFELSRPGQRQQDLHAELLKLASDRTSSLQRSHPLIDYARDLWSQGVEPKMFEILMRQATEESNNVIERAASTLRNLAKYPPALGMTGTVMGLVTMFSNLTPDKQTKLGASLALAMTATFYGLTLANAVVLPLADRLASLHLARVQMNDHLFRLLVLINRGEAPALIGESIRATA